MLETTLINYLSEELEIGVYLEEPEVPEKSYVLLDKTGSTESNQVSQATFAIQSYGKTLYEAALLNDRVKSVLKEITILPSIAACRLQTDYNYTDTTTKRYRYQAVYDIIYYD